jgi:hypothetical protein
MTKQLISEEFSRMQKLAGIISEIKAKSGLFSVDDYYDEDTEEVDLNAAFQNAPTVASYKDVLDIIEYYEDEREYYEDESILDDFKSEFPEGEDISKDDYIDFTIDFIDDISEVKYIKANWISIFDDTVYEKAGLY